MSCTQNINWNINRNPTIVKDLDISSSTGIIKEVLINKGGKNVIEWKTWIVHFTYLIGKKTCSRKIFHCN